MADCTGHRFCCVDFLWNQDISETALKKIRKELGAFNGEYIIDSANIETLLDGKHSNFFPSMGSTEKVDKAASKLLSGRIGIICDGSPYMLTAPYYFIEGFQSAEDYLKNPSKDQPPALYRWL